jgi:hypothetical protein
VTTKPSIDLHLLVKNGASVVGRLLDCVGPYVRGVVAVLNDCSDDTYGELLRGCDRHSLKLVVTIVRSELDRSLYFRDDPSSYEKGSALCGEVFPVELCTGHFVLGDWAGARNRGWGFGDSEWKLMLDADDVVEDPECLPMLVADMERQGLDALASEYVHTEVDGQPEIRCLRERLVRSRSGIGWDGIVHERLVGYSPTKIAHVRDTLRVRDARDSVGTNVRIPGRNLKVLYRAARIAGWKITPRHVALLAAESRQYMPELAAALADKYVRRDFESSDASTCGLVGPWWPEEAAWVCCMAGEASEIGLAGDAHLVSAALWYEKALRHYASQAAAWRLARVRHLLGDHQGCVSAWKKGLACLLTPQNIDGGAVILRRSVRCLVVGSMTFLGHFTEALELCREALRESPEDAALRAMEAKLAEMAVPR